MRLFLNQPIYAPSGQETPSDCTFTYTLPPKKKQPQQQIYCWSQLLILISSTYTYTYSFIIHIQLFRGRLSGKVHATILKGIVGGFEFSFFFQRNLKELVRKAMQMCLLVLKESNKSRFDSYSRQEPCTDHIPYYLSRLSRAHFFPTTFLEIAVCKFRA